MTPARHHAEWLSLVESSGPFLSMPVLLRVFPQGLDLRDSTRAAALRENYEDWLERGRPLLHVHTAWIRHVLESLLEWPADFIAEGQAIPAGLEASQPHFGETLRPDLVLRRPPGSTAEGDSTPQLLVVTYPPTQDLEKPVAGKVWKASPATRMTELLHATGVPLGLVTNGEHWMVVYAPRGETSGFASWYADLWMQEPVTLRAFHSLLGLRRFFGVAAGETLAALYAESAKDQQEVTDQLGRQVRRAVEMLVQAFDQIDAESNRTLLTSVPEKEVYDAALTVMMRLVFLFSAEERGLLLLGDPLFDQHYAVSTLRELLRERADQHGEEVLERRHDAWSRLLATFRAVHGGVQHEAMRLPAYGGSLFDPDRYPFLEGREAGSRWRETPAHPLSVNNRVVLHLLEALQLLRVKVPGGGPAEARRVSFRALDIEQIGHVYEGLLDHTARRTAEPVLGLDGKNEPEIPLAKLEELAGIVPATAEITLSDERMVADSPGSSVVDFPTRQVNYGKAPAALIDFLKEETGRTPKALQKSLDAFVDDHALLLACGQDPRLARRVRPFAGLLRSDDFGRLAVIRPGAVFVTEGTDRRSSGTHYTPRSLTEPIVKHTLEPLVYTGPAEGLPEAEWKLKSPKEILALKVCDMAMGSGAFLVQTCRYLAERLCEAWELAERDHVGSILVTPDGEFSAGSTGERLLPADPAERIALARRYVADRCLYGVDINPMAVEMAKLSLWLVTLQKDRPFSFLDHALKCGDSLLGVSDACQLERFSLRAADDSQPLFDSANLWRHVQQATTLRRQLEATPSHTASQLMEKARLHGDAETALARLRVAADFLLAADLDSPGDRGWETRRAIAASHMQAGWKKDLAEFQRLARAELRGRRPFHWSLEFPEVFDAGENDERPAGFDAFVGNPPFMGGLKLAPVFGKDYRDHLFNVLANGVTGARGTSDLCSFFFLRAHGFLRSNGFFGFLATNTIAQGDSRETGLDQLQSSHVTIIRAETNLPWPGDAALFVSVVHATKGLWKGEKRLDSQPVDEISTYLTSSTRNALLHPLALKANESIGFQGSNVCGQGFVINVNTATTWKASDAKYETILAPYLIGDDLNAYAEEIHDRWIINFFDWPLTRATNDLGPCASDFPEALKRINDTVKLERQSLPPTNHFNKAAAKNWWQYGGPRHALYRALRQVGRTLVTASASPTNAVTWMPSTMVFDKQVVCFPIDDDGFFTVMQSAFHWAWAWKYCSTLGSGTLRYSPTNCSSTLPFPENFGALRPIGASYYHARQALMKTRKEGLTTFYNRLHDRSEKSIDIAEFRNLHRTLDVAVAAAYGWTDLTENDGAALSHDFYPSKQGLRYTISEPARREVLDRLLALNHQRYAEEVAAGLHDKKSKNKPASAKPATKRGRKPKASTAETITPAMPADFRFPAPSPQLYAVNLVTALLSARPAGLSWQVLRDSFAAATTPALMRRLAFPQDRMQVAAWAGRWNEQATPHFLIPTLREMTGANIAVTGRGTDAVFALQDGPQQPATEDVAYDAWLALRVVEPLTSPALPDDDASVLDAEIENLLASL